MATCGLQRFLDAGIVFFILFGLFLVLLWHLFFKRKPTTEPPIPLFRQRWSAGERTLNLKLRIKPQLFLRPPKSSMHAELN
jgi:hypothetical protein